MRAKHLLPIMWLLPFVSIFASTHWLTSIENFGSFVELEDGAVWLVSHYDQSKARHWHSNDPLVITQNHRWFSYYSYRIIHQNSGVSVEANLYTRPQKGGEYTLSVVSLGHETTRLTNDHLEITDWEICPRDDSLFNQWKLYDTIIIGQNSDWDSHYESILINIDKSHFVQAKQIQD
jgi:hypothetical protein